MACHPMPDALPSPAYPALNTPNPPGYQHCSRDGVGCGQSLRLLQPPLLAPDQTYSTCPISGLYTPPEEMTAGIVLKAPVPVPYKYSQTQKPVESPYHAHSNSAPSSHDIGIPADQVVLQRPPSLTSFSPTFDDKDNTGSAIVSHLQIPSSINESKSSLAEFAAQIACLFWFETAPKLKMIEDGLARYGQVPPAVPESIPSIGFRKWVTTMLATTQVSQNVILLALLFIYRLKKLNPTVKGRRGSEYRLTTIALMMGNKFLDDNTYTNKTWAEVSGISFQEIHVMEVEFLSNIRYNLVVSKEEWESWHRTLGLFSEYLDQTNRGNEKQSKTLVLKNSSSSAPALQPTGYSPPNYSQNLPVRGMAHYNNGHGPWKQTIPLEAPSTSAPVTEPLDTLRANRKRASYHEDIHGHVAKRLATSNEARKSVFSNHPPANPSVWSYPVHPTIAQSAAHIAAPAITLPNPTMQFGGVPATTTAARAVDLPLPTMPAQPVHRPATQPVPRTYPPPTSLSQPSLIPTTSASVHTAGASLQSLFPESMGANPHVRYPITTSSCVKLSPSRALPVHTTVHDLSPPPDRSAGSIPPVTEFIDDRNSPYRPVRHVNTLLYPPPPSSLHRPRKLSVDQMYYQPLSKSGRGQRSGVLPRFPGEGYGAWAPPLGQTHLSVEQRYGISSLGH